MARLMTRILGTALALAALIFAMTVDTGAGSDASAALLIGVGGVVIGLGLIIASFQQSPPQAPEG